MSDSQLALPAATFAESEGTLVSSEGRAQRHYPVFVPPEERQASWQWLSQIGCELGTSGFEQLTHFDQVVQACAHDVPALSQITFAAPGHEFRNHGLKIPRQPARYSGRTAMRSDVSVHEPKQPMDEETPLAFSMEGLDVGQPSALMSSSWSPGWNSNQSIQKFQDEAGGAIKGGSAGVRLIESGSGLKLEDITVPDTFKPDTNERLLVPVYRIFGSDELSAQSPAIAELAGVSQVVLGPEDAANLQVKNGDGVAITFESKAVILEVVLDGTMAKGCVGYTAGMAGTESLVAGSMVCLEKAIGWERRTPELIATDSRSFQNPNALELQPYNSENGQTCTTQSGVSHV